MAPIATLSNPSTERSPGIRSPRRPATDMAIIATVSLRQMRAVGRPAGGADRRRRTARRDSSR